MNLPISTCNAILFRTHLQSAIDRSTSPAHAFVAVQDMAARLADTLEDRNAANLLMAFAMLVHPRDALSILETFADLTDGLPSEAMRHE